MWSSRRSWALVWLLFLFLVQNAAGCFIPMKAPYFLLAGTVFYGLLEGPAAGAVLGAVAGLFLELFSTGPFGAQMGLLACIGAVSGLVAKKIFRDNFGIQIGLPAAAYLFYTLASAALVSGVAVDREVVQTITVEALDWTSIALAGTVAPVVFAFLRRTLPPRRQNSAWA